MLQKIDNDYDVSIATIKDAEQVLFLLKEVATWLSENNIDQWESLAEGEKDEEIIASIRNQETFCVKKDNQLVATFVLYQKQAPWDINLWGNLPDEAIYVHRFALTRSEIGHGLGKKVLRWIENYTIHHDLDILRLDCVEENKKLNRFYLSNGFKRQNTHHGFSLYEKMLHKDKYDSYTN